MTDLEIEQNILGSLEDCLVAEQALISTKKELFLAERDLNLYDAELKDKIARMTMLVNGEEKQKYSSLDKRQAAFEVSKKDDAKRTELASVYAAAKETDELAGIEYNNATRRFSAFRAIARMRGANQA